MLSTALVASADAVVVVVVIVAMLKQVGVLWFICDEMGSHVLD
jgi:hypothetical protein